MSWTVTSQRLAASLWARRLITVALLAGLVGAAWHFGGRRDMPAGVSTTLVLLLPDGADADDVRVQAWQAAANELGFPLELSNASQLLRTAGPMHDRALIVPDGVHTRMNDQLLARLQALVEGGTRLMLVHDAGRLDLNGAARTLPSRLTALAGVDYARSSVNGRNEPTREQPVWADVTALPQLRLPPGKLVRQGGDRPLVSAQTPPDPDEELALVGYQYGRLRYPMFETRGAYQGKRLLHAAGGVLVAGVRRVGRGQVLFVNLPLGYLKLRTDALPLHSLLRFFAEDVCELPHLAAQPKAQGGLIMNWHIDAAAAVPALNVLDRLGMFEQGPYSVHLTAGPDVDRPGDGLGMDLQNNVTMQSWVRRFVSRQDEVGSHGGWIHNEFGRLVDTQDAARSIALIDLNSNAVSSASKRPVREYSAPTGNHPAWVTRWLQQRGVSAFYFTGDIGMPPTRSFQDGRPAPPGIWAIPLLSYGVIASFEEARAAGVAEADIGAWLVDVAEYCALNRTVRMVYFHPPGAATFSGAIARWLKTTASLVQQGSLQWMTMTQVAEFANLRSKVQWRLEPAGPGAPALALLAHHPESLDRMTWLLPKSRYERPLALSGAVLIDGDARDWRVVAGPGTDMRLRLPLRPALPGLITRPNPAAALALSTASMFPPSAVPMETQ